MKKKLLLSTLSSLATLDALSFVVVVTSAGACGRGDGCLVFSLLLLVTFGFGLLVLVLSAVAWLIARRSEVIPNYFLFANLIVLVFVIATAGVSVSYTR
jgi:hypothetical protein